MINCREIGNDIFQNLMVFEWLQADIIFEANGCIILIPPIVECHIAGKSDVSKERKMTFKNHAYTR